MYGAVAQVGGKIYVAGGFDGPTTIGPWLSVYDPASNTWSAKADMPQARTYAGAHSLGGKLYIVGGRTTAGNDGATLVYDPATNVWSPLAPMPSRRHFLSAAGIAGQIYAVGGVTTVTVATVERYTP